MTAISRVTRRDLSRKGMGSSGPLQTRAFILFDPSSRRRFHFSLWSACPTLPSVTVAPLVSPRRIDLYPGVPWKRDKAAGERDNTVNSCRTLTICRTITSGSTCLAPGTGATLSKSDTRTSRASRCEIRFCAVGGNRRRYRI